MTHCYLCAKSDAWTNRVVCIQCVSEAPRIVRDANVQRALLLVQSLSYSEDLHPWLPLFTVPRHASWSLWLLLLNLLRWSTRQRQVRRMWTAVALHNAVRVSALRHSLRLIDSLRAERRAVVAARRRCALALQRAAHWTVPDDLLCAVLMEWVDVLFCHEWQRIGPPGETRDVFDNGGPALYTVAP